MTNVPMIPQGMAIPAALQGLFNTQPADDLTGGVGGMPILSVRGRVFRFKYRGVEQPIVDQAGYAIPYLDVIVVKASPLLSKIYYASAYNEGDDNAPDCWSIDGVVPDAQAPQKQCTTCAACPQNMWGSKITPQGNRTKACADSRRLALVPAGDPMNVNWGGVTMLRVPPASLADLATYGNSLQAAGLPYQAVITRLSWDMSVAFPKLTYQFGGMINDEQAKAVVHWMNSEQTTRLLSAANQPSPQPVAAPAGPPPYQQPVTPSVFAGTPVPPTTFQHPPSPPNPFAVAAGQATPATTQPVVVMQQPVASTARPEPPPGWAWNAEGTGFVQAPQQYAPPPPMVQQSPVASVVPPQPQTTFVPPPPPVAAPQLTPGNPGPVELGQQPPVGTRRGRPRAQQPVAPSPPATGALAPPVAAPTPTPNGADASVSPAPAELENLLGNILKTS